MSPLISVVIPTFNQRDFLEQALESVFAQSVRDYEIIVVDDGSTDSTGALLDWHGDRLRVIEQENHGVGAARNRGIDAARGRYLALLDHDDKWHPDKLAVQLKFMQEHPDAVGCSVQFRYTEPLSKLGFDIGIRGSDGMVDNALERYADGHLFLLSSIMMLDLAKVGDLRYETRRDSIEDIALQIRLLLRGPYGIAGDSPLATYRVHAANTSNSARRLLHGVEHLRLTERSEGFGPCTPAQLRAINGMISAMARKALVAQAAVGERARALRGYLSEWPQQWRNRRFRFLVVFPLLLAIPSGVLQRFRQFRSRE
jgi:glycosyltransferase involved in cell wall biosynthesis